MGRAPELADAHLRGRAGEPPAAPPPRVGPREEAPPPAPCAPAGSRVLPAPLPFVDCSPGTVLGLCPLPSLRKF